MSRKWISTLTGSSQRSSGSNSSISPFLPRMISTDSSSGTRRRRVDFGVRFDRFSCLSGSFSSFPSWPLICRSVGWWCMPDSCNRMTYMANWRWWRWSATTPSTSAPSSPIRPNTFVSASYSFGFWWPPGVWWLSSSSIRTRATWLRTWASPKSAPSPAPSRTWPTKPEPDWPSSPSPSSPNTFW